MRTGTRRSVVADLEARRRDYLRKLWRGYLAVVAGPVSLVSLVAGVGATVTLVHDLMEDADNHAPHWHESSRFLFMLPLWPLLNILLILALGAIAIACGLWANTQWVEAEDLEYVPSVAEQIAILPSDEVLLRGANSPEPPGELLLRSAEQPEPPPGEMLRAAVSSAETDEQELLRSGEGRTI